MGEKGWGSTNTVTDTVQESPIMDLDDEQIEVPLKRLRQD